MGSYIFRGVSKRKVESTERDFPSPPSSTAAKRRKTFPSGIKVLYNPEDSIIDIIFVHGLTGDREKTWTAKDADSPWPHTLLPAKVPNARILTFGYDAYVTNWTGVVSKNRIRGHSMNLLSAVAAYRDEDDTNSRPIIFVCHSLGGLVCEDALVEASQSPEDHLQNIHFSTRGILFLGTPHNGSGLAGWAEKLAKSIGVLKQTNPEIVSTLRSDSEVLERIQGSFHSMIRSRSKKGFRPIEITCFYEELPLLGVGVVVPPHSANLPGYISIGIHSNHMDMTKFEGKDDPGFVLVTGELRRWMKRITQGDPELASTAISQQQQHISPRRRSSSDPDTFHYEEEDEDGDEEGHTRESEVTDSPSDKESSNDEEDSDEDPNEDNGEHDETGIHYLETDDEIDSQYSDTDED